MSRQPSRRCPRASGIGHRSRPQAGSGGSWPRCIVKTWRSCLRNSAKSPPPLRTCRRAFSATADSGKEKRYAMTCPWRHKHNPFHRKVRYHVVKEMGARFTAWKTVVKGRLKLLEVVHEAFRTIGHHVKRGNGKTFAFRPT